MINCNYDDCYFSDSDGYYESKYVFIDGNSITSSISGEVYIGETGFGSGLNLLVLEDFLEDSSVSNLNLCFTTVEKYPLRINDVVILLKDLNGITHNSLNRHAELYKELHDKIEIGWNSFKFYRKWGELTINIFIGDISESFIKYPCKNDAWFLDGHSPDKNPDMWNENVFRNVANYSIPGTTFATFTAAGLVKRGLRDSGFYVRRKKGFGRKRHMIYGHLEKS